jgi:hypothetical protein
VSVPALSENAPVLHGWEFAVVNAYLSASYMAEIAVMGWKGWELVSTVPFNGEFGIRFFFKRPTALASDPKEGHRSE